MLRACLAALVTLGTGLALLATAQTASADSGDTVTTVLQPGLNLAGWTEAEASVEAIFDAIPELELVYAWDAENQRFRWAARVDSLLHGDLETLTPGMGLWLAIGGGEPVTWTRPLIPQTGLAPLHEGWNLVVWAGDDGVATSDALQEVDDLASEAVDANGEPLATLTRGRPFWLKVSAAKQWWQLDEPPQIEFASDYSPEEQQELRARVDEVVAYFARRFGFGIPGLTVRFGDDTIDACGHYAHPAVVLKSYCSGALAHEYAHALQRYLVDLGRSPYTGSGFPNPAWIVEGGANRWAGQYFAASGGYSYEARVTETVGLAARQVTAPLRSAEEHPLDYRLAEFAVDWLTTQAGEDSLYDYYARRAAHRTWQDAFLAILGITALDFYEQFETYRAKVAPPFPRIGGIVLGPDGAPQERVTVRVDSRSGAGSSSRFTDAEGRFEWGVEAGAYDLSLSAEGCALEWSSPDERLEPTDAERASLVLDADGLMELVLNLSAATSEQCSRIEGVVLGPDGAPQEGVTARIHNQAEGWSRVRRTDAEGRFEWTIAGGSYDLSLSTDGCALEWSSPDKRLAPIDAERASFVLDAAVTGLNLNLSAALSDQCSRIEGVVLGPDGAPQEEVSVRVHYQSEGRSNARFTDAEGRFGWSVENGSYDLTLSIGGCSLDWSSPDKRLVLTTAERGALAADEAVTGLVLNLSTALSEQCSRFEGSVLGPGGAPQQGVWVVVRDLSTGRGRYLGTNAQGTFDARVDTEGSYEVSVILRGCPLQWSSSDGRLEYPAANRAHFSAGADLVGLVFNLPAAASELCRSVEGVVLGPGGAPVEGITITVADVSDGESRSALTREDGKFEWTLESGSYELSLSSEDCSLDWSTLGDKLEKITGSRARLELDDTAPTGLVILLAALPSELCPGIRGVVTGPDGAPQQSVAVRLRNLSTGTNRTQETDAEGAFGWSVDNGSSYEISLSSNGCPLRWSSADSRLQTATRNRASFTADPDGFTGLVLRLPATASEQCARIEGVVLGPEGVPVEGVTVRIRDVSDGGSRSAVTREDGKFEWALGTGSYELSLSTGGCTLEWTSTDGRLESTSPERASVVLDAAGLTGLVLHLSEALSAQCARIEGVVLGPDGAPTEGISLRVHNGPRVEGHGATDDTGEFEVLVEGGSYDLSLFSDGCVLNWSGSDDRLEALSPSRARFVVGEGGVTGLALRLSATPSEQCRWLRGVVTDLAGTPRGRVTLWVYSAAVDSDGRVVTSVPRGSPDSSGDFNIRVPKGHHSITMGIPMVMSVFYGGDSGLVRTSSEATLIDVETSDATGLTISFGFIRGTVLGSDLSPLEAIQIHLYRLKPGKRGYVRGSRVLTNPSGRFANVASAGTYVLEVVCPGQGGGWYGGASGFTADSGEATPIVLNRADAAEIVINLPITAAELGSRACGPRQPIKGFVLRSDGSPVSGLVVGRTEELTTVYGGPYRYEYRNWATLFNGSFALPTAGAPVPISMALFPETGCPDFRRVNIPLMILGRVDASGIFTPATDLPQGVSVEASDSENIVVRLPACP